MSKEYIRERDECDTIVKSTFKIYVNQIMFVRVIKDNKIIHESKHVQTDSLTVRCRY